MVAELLTLLMSLSVSSSSNACFADESSFVIDSPCSLNYSEKDDSKVSVSFGSELFYFDEYEFKEFPNSFEENSDSYFLSVLETSLSITKNNLNHIEITSGINVFDIVFNGEIPSQNEVKFLDNAIYFRNVSYEISSYKVVRKDLISDYESLCFFAIASSFDNVTIEIYDCDEMFVSIDDYDSFLEKQSIDAFDFSLCSFPLTIISSIQYYEPIKSSAYIQDKYFEVGSYSCVEDTSLLTIGKSNILGFDQFGNPYNPEYKAVFELTLPTFSTGVPHYLNISLNIKYSSGTLNSLYAYEVTNKTYSEMNGVTSYSKKYLGIMSKSGYFYSLEYRTTYNEITSLNNKLVLVLEGHVNNSLAHVFANESLYSPSLLTDHHSIYGSSTAYNYIASGNQPNCYGYVLKKTIGLDIGTLPSNSSLPNLEPDNYVANMVISDLGAKGFVGRRIDAYNSYIDSSERRIAMRYSVNSGGNFGFYHFMKECSDGRWADKNGLSASEVHDYGENPNNTTCSNWAFYSSSVIYFAIQYST